MSVTLKPPAAANLNSVVSKVVTPVTSMSRIPASISTIDPALALASNLNAVPAVCAVLIKISLALPETLIARAPEAVVVLAAELSV